MAVQDPSSIQAPRIKSAGGFLFTFGVACTLLYLGRVFFITLLVAIFISFILEPVVEVFMRTRMARGVASFLVCSLALVLLYLVGLLAFSQASGLEEDLPLYSKRFSELADKVLEQVEATEKNVNDIIIPRRLREQQPPPPQPVARRRRPTDPPPVVLPPPVQEVRIKPERSPVVDYLVKNVSQFYDLALMVSFIPFLVYFMLSWRDHFVHNFLRVFDGEARNIAAVTLEGIAHMTRAFVVGNFILGLLLALITTAFFYAIKVPYSFLVGPLSGFLSLVPYVGLPLAVIPPFVAALTAFTNLTAYVLIGSTVAFFHLLGLNLLYPKLVGSRVHLNPLVVTVALMFWGFLWGGIGLVLAIPLTAAIKGVCDHIPGLSPYGRMMGD